MTGLLFTFSLLCSAVIQTDAPLLHGAESAQLRSPRQALLTVIRSLPALTPAARTLVQSPAGMPSTARAAFHLQSNRGILIAETADLNPFAGFNAHLIRGPTH